MKRLGNVLRDAWLLARPYFASEERYSAWALLIGTILLNLTLVALTVWNNYWYNAIYNCLQNKDIGSFWKLLLIGQRSPAYHFGVMPGFLLVAVFWITVAVYNSYLNQWLQIRWRRWSTEHTLRDWLAQGAYYRISLTAKSDGMGTDNPDQRIAEDINLYISYTLSIGLDLMSNVVTVFSFVGVLWSLSGTFVVFGVAIKGYLVWFALVNAIIANYLMNLIGRPLIPLNFAQQRYEANFRFHLARMRENPEGIALYRGEATEYAGLRHKFGDIFGNFMQIIRRTKLVNGFASFNSLIGSVVAYIVAGPRFFAGGFTLGDLTQIIDSFGQLQSAMSWLAGSGTYSDVATWAATVERLATFQRAIAVAHQDEAGFDRELAETPGLEDVTVNLPDGTPLIEGASLEFAPGRSVTLHGPSGSGKSTLFRVLAGIWPFGEGRVTAPVEKPMFLPQRPYFPLGNLRAALAYPGEAGAFKDSALREALSDAGLEHLADRLDETANWTQLLSGGEQQRLAIARALLQKPAWLFLDEATSALDPAAEAAIQAVLAAKLPHTTRIAISHDPLAADRQIALREGQLTAL